MKTIAAFFACLLLTPLAITQAGNEAPKPAPEMEKLIKMWAGHWTTVELFEPSDEMPKGKQDKGAETMRPGPGGFSLIGDYESHGAHFGHLVVTWIPAEKAYKSYWTDLSGPGVSVSTGKWEGGKLVFTSIDESSGKKILNRDTYSDITPTSFTDTLESGPIGGSMKKILTVKYTKQENVAQREIPSAQIAKGAGCEVSKKFEVKKVQRLAGVLKDPMEAPLPGFQLNLLKDGKTILSRTTDNEGAYDLGEIAPGKYKIRLSRGGNVTPFCAPSVKCEETGCKVNSILKLGPQVTVVM